MGTLSLVATLLLIASSSTNEATLDEPAALPRVEAAEAPTDCPPVPLGTRVRIEIVGGSRFVGNLSSWESNAAGLLVEEGDRPFVISRSMIAQVERSTRHESRAGVGALVGGLLGAIIGAIYLDRYTVPIGALAGALIGHASPLDRWEPVAHGQRKPLSIGLRLAPAPGRGIGARVALSWN